MQGTIKTTMITVINCHLPKNAYSSNKIISSRKTELLNRVKKTTQ